MPSFVNTFGGTNIYAANVSYRAIALTANVTLTWPTEVATNTDVVASIMDVTPSAGSLTIRMPDATQASVGETALFFNVGAFSFTVADNGGNTIQTIASGEAWQIYMIGNATVNGTWRAIEYGAGTSSPSASALAGAGLKAITTTLNQAAPTTLLSADYTLTSSDRARVLVWNGGAGTFTMPSAVTAGNDWFFDARNSGSGGLTIAPAGGELINGQASLVFNPGDSARILTDGTSFYTIGYGQSATFAFDYVSISLTGQPSPYTLTGTNLNRIAYQFSGVLTANMQIIVPNTIQQYWVRNTTTGAYSLTVKTAAGTGIAVVQNGAAILYCDGTNVVEADTNNLSTPIGIAQGGTGATTAGTALINLGGTSLGIGIFTAVNAAVARASIGAAASGANADITSLTGLTTPLSVSQGGTGQTTYTNGQLLIGNTTGNTLTKATLTAGTGITVTNSTGSITITNTGPDTFPGVGIAYSTGTAWGTSYGTTGTGLTVALSASPAFTGTPTAPTATAGTNTTQIATTAFVLSTAFSAALPSQTGNAGKFVTTDGTNASFSFVPLTTGVSGTLPAVNGGTGISSYAVGDLVFANTTTTVDKLPVGAASFLLASNGTAPLYVNPTTVTVGNATNAVTATSATTATTATNLGGGAAGSIPYQSGAGATTFLASGTGVLVNAAGNPSYSMTPSLTQVTVAGNPTVALQVATKQYVDTLIASGIHFHAPVRVESPINLNATYNNGTAGVGATLTNAGTQLALVIDGVTVNVADRVLVYQQTNSVENGIYVVTDVGSVSTNWILTRSSDADTYVINSAAGLSEGSTVFVQQGTTGAGESYTCNTSGVITFGTTAITFAQISATQIYSAGTGLTLTGTTFSLTAPVTAVLGGTGLTSPGTNGNVLTSNGTTWVSQAPAASGASKGQAIAFSLIFGL